MNLPTIGRKKNTSKQKQKSKVQETYIHIHAKCNFFEIHEQVMESKAIERLTSIREVYSTSKVNWKEKGKLVVKTVVVNPKMF